MKVYIFTQSAGPSHPFNSYMLLNNKLQCHSIVCRSPKGTRCYMDLITLVTMNHKYIACISR